MPRSLHSAALIAALAIPATHAVAQNRTFTISSGFPDSAVPPKGYGNVSDWLSENHGIDTRIFSMTLLSFPETPAGIRDGMTDIGYVLTPYFPAEFSETNMAADMTLLVSEGTDAPGLVMAGAMAEYVMLDCDGCQAQFADQGQVFLGGGASAEYSLVCNRPVTTVDEISELSIRSGAAVFSRWVEHFGGTKVSISGGEMYEALSQGVVDCTMVSLPDILNYQLQDVTKNVMVGAPGGVFAGTASMNMNRDLWRSLTGEERRAMLDAGAMMTAEVAVGYYNDAVAAERELRDMGYGVMPVSDEISKATQAFVATDLPKLRTLSTDVYGVDGVADKMERMRALVERWKGLVAEIDPTDTDAFRQLMLDEVYSRVDASTYGMDG